MKIDTSSIDGYQEMTTEQKLEALESFEFEVKQNDPGEIKRLKDAVSRANSEAADYKKQLRAKQTAEEAQAAQAAEEREAIMKELEGLKKDKAISSFQAKFMSLGYDAESAHEAAKAMEAGDYDTVFSAQAKFIEETKKNAVIDSLKTQPGITGGAPLSGNNIENSTVAAFRKAARI